MRAEFFNYGWLFLAMNGRSKTFFTTEAQSSQRKDNVVSAYEPNVGVNLFARRCQSKVRRANKFTPTLGWAQRH
ncbi:MAG: hypothetical protein COA54_13950 [Thiotrichaceae bacterium]|nr:MAG: hypothetical protein COA54_13950 [Thiotrichaceae bacterium]